MCHSCCPHLISHLLVCLFLFPSPPPHPLPGCCKRTVTPTPTVCKLLVCFPGDVTQLRSGDSNLEAVTRGLRSRASDVTCGLGSVPDSEALLSESGRRQLSLWCCIGRFAVDVSLPSCLQDVTGRFSSPALSAHHLDTILVFLGCTCHLVNSSPFSILPLCLPLLPLSPLPTVSLFRPLLPSLPLFQPVTVLYLGSSSDLICYQNHIVCCLSNAKGQSVCSL